MTITDDITRTRSAKPQLEQEPIGSMMLPVGLLDDVPAEFRHDAYVMRLDGDCLEPKVHDGDCALIAPGMPIRRGDFVVLWPKNPVQRPAIKRLVMAPMEGWEKFNESWEGLPLVIVEQLNPPRQYRIGVDKLSAIQRVVTTFRPGDHERVAIKPRPLKRQRRVAGGRR